MPHLNVNFYQNIKMGTFMDIAQQSGFDICPDMDLIYSQIQNTKSLAELGGGYGRCVDYLLSNHYKGHVYCVERAGSMVNYMRQHFESHASQIEIFHQDICDLKLPERVDAVLWLWSGILEQTKAEQRLCIARIKSCLNPKGILFIDTPHSELKVFGTKLDDHIIRVDTDWGSLEAYLPSSDEIKNIAEECGLLFEAIPYQTPTGLKRMMYQLQKMA
ncbi:MAG: methyltransferase domain-containing protein [Cytophagales bacterium]|nr:MAG: methyltransferase domain-containing protein [Cytophagales bacterium]TAF62335.1 MAG: methyltransferase domain-containing protein [Cytophagales bacterium]